MRIRPRNKSAINNRKIGQTPAIYLPTCVLALAGACSVSVAPPGGPSVSVTPTAEPEVCIGSEPVSCFFTGDDGWRVLGGDFAGLTRPVWELGVVSAEGEGDWYWVAPAKFLGGMLEFFGGRLSFEIDGGAYRCGYSSNAGGRVRLSGAGLALRWDREYSTVAYDRLGRFATVVLLDETESWINETTGLRASDADIMAVLGQLDRLEILGMERCFGTSKLYRVQIN